MRLLHPLPADEQQRVAAVDVEAAVKDALLPVAGDGDASLFPAPSVSAVERRRLGDDRLVEHQQDGALAPTKPAF